MAVAKGHIGKHARPEGEPQREDRNMRDPQALISTEQLETMLGQSHLRIYDCTTYLEPAPANSGEPYLPVPGRRSYEQGHIPAADFLDLQGEFSRSDTQLRFMMPATASLEAAFGQHGVAAGTHVVLYSIGSMMWATRFWWMLKALGFDEVSVLDGGFDKWSAEGRPVEVGPGKGYPVATFQARPRPGFFSERSSVLAALGDGNTAIINALGPQFHRGLEPSRYGRPGRIPGSVNVPAASLVEANKCLTSLAEASAKFAAQGVNKDKNVICYCGGGISATIDLFMLYQLGYENLTLYDASMGEWAKDPSLPIETD
jgi:thiosulfate/3-mercaptopyruvate sulfurtransferase